MAEDSYMYAVHIINTKTYSETKRDFSKLSSAQRWAKIRGFKKHHMVSIKRHYLEDMGSSDETYTAELHNIKFGTFIRRTGFEDLASAKKWLKSKKASYKHNGNQNIYHIIKVRAN
jgi:hypothetical protein